MVFDRATSRGPLHPLDAPFAFFVVKLFLTLFPGRMKIAPWRVTFVFYVANSYLWLRLCRARLCVVNSPTFFNLNENPDYAR
jgi:hypothetical protein